MEARMKLEISDTDAMIVAVIAVEEFAAMPLRAMAPEQRAAVSIYFAGMMARVVDKIPRTEATAYIFPVIEDAFELARHARELLHLQAPDPGLTQKPQ